MVADTLGTDTTGGLLASIGSSTATGAGMGAMLGVPGAVIGGAVGLGMGVIKNWDSIQDRLFSKDEVSDSLELAEQNQNIIAQNQELAELVAIMKDQTKTSREQVEAAKTLTTALTNNTNVTNQNTDVTGASNASNRRRQRNRAPISDDGGPSP
jgi:hypothetical protein